MIICSEDKCFGCGACAAKCPTNCIEMKVTENGFDFPFVDTSRCVNCNACIKVCPAINTPELKIPQKTYAGWAIDEEVHRSSSSGGVSDVIVRKIIDNGGIAFGAVMNDDFSVNHCVAKSLNESKAFKKSKYVWSHTLNTYKHVKEALESDCIVLYTGTPCQIAGLKSYVGDNNNLFCVDLVCHGTPSEKLLCQHIKEIEKKSNKTADEVLFRNNGLKLSLCQGDICFYSRKSTEDLWYIGFLKGLFYKQACYSCPFAKKERVSDITLGDFWGLNDVEIQTQAKHGVSLILVNTEKGEKLLELISDCVILHEQPLKKAVSGNKQLRMPSTKHKNYDKFNLDLKNHTFEKAAKKSLRKERLIYLIARILGRA